MFWNISFKNYGLCVKIYNNNKCINEQIPCEYDYNENIQNINNIGNIKYHRNGLPECVGQFFIINNNTPSLWYHGCFYNVSSDIIFIQLCWYK